MLTAPPERLVVMLYDGARRFLKQASAAMRAGDVPGAHERLRRAERIVEHLLATLDMRQGDISQRLEAIYAFFLKQLADARVRQDPAPLEKVDELLGELREAWAALAAGGVAAGRADAGGSRLAVAGRRGAPTAGPQAVAASA